MKRKADIQEIEASIGRPAVKLTQKQATTLRYLVSGMSLEQIAATEGITYVAAENRAWTVKTKFGVKSLPSLLEVAKVRGYVEMVPAVRQLQRAAKKKVQQNAGC